MPRGPPSLPPTPLDRSPRNKRNSTGCISISSNSRPAPSREYQSLSFLQSPTHARSNSGSLLPSTTFVSSNILSVNGSMSIDAPSSFKDAFANIWGPVASESGSGSGAPVASSPAVYPPEPQRKRFSHSAASYATYSSTLSSFHHHQQQHHHNRESKRSSGNNSHALRKTAIHPLFCPSQIDNKHSYTNSKRSGEGLSTPSASHQSRTDMCSCSSTPSPSSLWTSLESKRKGNSPTAKQEPYSNSPSTSPSPLSSSPMSPSSFLSTSPVNLGATNMSRCSPDLPPSLRLLPEDVLDASPSSPSSNASSLMSSPTIVTATDKRTRPTSTRRKTSRRPASMDSTLSFGCDCCSAGCISDLAEDIDNINTNPRRRVKGLSGGYFSCEGDTTTTGVVHTKDTMHIDTDTNKNASLLSDSTMSLLLSTPLVDMQGDRPHHPHHPHHQRKSPCLSASCTVNDSTLAHSHLSHCPTASPVSQHQHHQHHHNRHHRHPSPSQVATTDSPTIAQISSQYIRLLLLPLLPLLLLAVCGHTSSKFDSPMKYNV